MLCAPRWMRLLSKAWLPFVSVIEQSGIELDHSLDRAAALAFARAKLPRWGKRHDLYLCAPGE